MNNTRIELLLISCELALFLIKIQKAILACGPNELAQQQLEKLQVGLAEDIEILKRLGVQAVITDEQ